MNPAQEMRLVQITPPQILVDANPWVCAEIDTLDWDYCTIVVQLGGIAANMAVLRVDHGNATGVMEARANATLGNANCINIEGDAALLPATATDENTFQVFQFDMRHNRRFLQLVAEAGAGNTYLSAFAILTRAKSKPVTMDELGCDEVVRL
jgi:hypothetical protein